MVLLSIELSLSYYINSFHLVKQERYIVVMTSPDASRVISPDVSLEDNEPVPACLEGSWLMAPNSHLRGIWLKHNCSRPEASGRESMQVAPVSNEEELLLHLIQEQVGRQRKGRSREAHPDYS